jgi:hypothetical protein
MKTLIVLVLLLLALNASADEVMMKRYPINLAGIGREYNDLDRNITDRIGQVLSNNPQYELLQGKAKDRLPRIDYLLMYTNESNGLIVLSLLALLQDKKLKYPAYLQNGITFCTTQNQYQCILDATSVLQTAINSYNNPQIFKQLK